MASENKELVRVLEAEAADLAARQRDLEEQSRGIGQELEHIRMRQDLIRALLDTSGDQDRGRTAILTDGDRQTAAGRRNGGVHRDVADIAYEILLSLGKKPIYYEALAEEVQKAGGKLGGATPGQTLVARISRDPRFVRPEKRGWYAARDFYPRAKNVGARKPGSPRDKKSAETRRRATK